MAETYIYVYRTVCETNGKSYIGVHKTKDMNDGYIGCGIKKPSDAFRKTVFHRAVRKHGYASFSKHILSFFDTYEDALAVERELVDEAWVKNDGNYNCAVGGMGNVWAWLSKEKMDAVRLRMSAYRTGKKHTQETKDRMSKMLTGRKLSEAHVKTLIDSNVRYWKGKKRPEAAKIKQSATCTGRKLSDWHRSRISEAKKGKTTLNVVAVVQFDLVGNIISEYSSLREAQKGSGVKVTTIHNSLKQNRKTGNFIFKYKKDL
jgi:group I intron endonuclease